MVRKSVAEILQDHVILEGIDRMYLNAYVPLLQTGAGFTYFLRSPLDRRVPSTFMSAPMSKKFVAAIERFVETEDLDLVSFERGERKDDLFTSGSTPAKKDAKASRASCPCPHRLLVRACCPLGSRLFWD
jgi:hypothetical protein